MNAVDELFVALAALTKLKDPRDDREFKDLKVAWPEGFPLIEDTLVDEVLRHLLACDLAGRMALLKRLVEEAPMDVVMILNQKMIKRPAYVEMIKEHPKNAQATKR